MTHDVDGIIIVGILAMLVCLSSSDYAGLSFKLDRFDNDKFENPKASNLCHGGDHQFCTDTNSRCYGHCCRCACDYPTSTFDSSEMKCQDNSEFRKGCSVKFGGKKVDDQIKTLDLAKLGEAKIYWPVQPRTDVVKSFNITSIAFYHDGSEVQDKFLTKKGNVNRRKGRIWDIFVKWDQVSQDYHGQLFKVDISYTVEKQNKGNKYLIPKNDCFVFKSSGSTTVTFPSPTTSTVSSSTTEESTAASTTQFSTSTTQSSTSTTQSATSTTPFSTSTTQSARSTTQSSTSTTPFSTSTTQSARSTTPSSASTTPSSTSTTGSVKPPVSTSEIPMTTKDSQKTRKTTEPAGKTAAEPSKTGRTVAARNEGDGNEGGSNAVAISLAVVGCFLLLIGVMLLVFWFRRRSGRASQKKGAVDAKESASNAVMMSQVESIYAEADNSANYSEKGKNNYVYDYTEGNVDGDYTSLDMSKVESKPTYQSLINAQASLYEQIPADYDKNCSGVSGLNGGTPVTEPFYHVVDGQTQEPSEIYHVLEEPEVTGDCKTREVPGRTGPENPERVYSTLEENTPENCDRGVPEGTGDDNPERLYSVLEDENAESDYVKIQPETSDYEKPVNPPTSDA